MATTPNATAHETLQTQRDGLVKKIQAEIGRLEKLAEQDRNAEKIKGSARAAYEAALDRGDESEMSRCLSRIREANRKCEGLIGSLSEREKALSELRDSHEELRAESIKLLTDAQQQMRIARDAFHATDKLHDSIAGILSQLNELGELLLQAKERSGVVVTDTNE